MRRCAHQLGTRVGDQELIPSRYNSETGLGCEIAPDRRNAGELIEIADATEVTADNKQSVVLRASIDAENIEITQARTGITAKIICGRTSLGHLWLHDVKEFLQKNVMFLFS